MRYLVSFSWWYEGEFEAASLKAKKAREKDPTVDRDFPLQFMMQFRNDKEFFVEAESEEAAVADGMTRVEIDHSRVDDKLSSFRAVPIPYLTIRELLDNAPVKSTTHDIHRALEFFPVVDEWDFDSDLAEIHKATSIDYYLDICFDGRRGMELGCVRFHGNPVLVFSAAGRENRDYKAHWVVDAERKRGMTKWLMGFVKPEEENETSLDEEIPELSYFYGNSILDVAQ